MIRDHAVFLVISPHSGWRGTNKIVVKNDWRRMAVGLKNIHQRGGRRRLFAAAAGFLITPFAVSALQTERTPANATAHSSAATGPLPIFYDAMERQGDSEMAFSCD
jgi:hypothetical protein